MGVVCNKEIQTREQATFEIYFGKVVIFGPPAIQKPSYLQSVSFLDDEIILDIEKEQFSPKKEVLPTEQQVIENDFKFKDVQVSLDENILFRQVSDNQEQQNQSKEEKSNLQNDGKGSNQSIQKHKSILKNKNPEQSNPQSPGVLKDSSSFGSQKSNKKVTFDKKQKVIYSSFRKIKYY